MPSAEHCNQLADVQFVDANGRQLPDQSVGFLQVCLNLKETGQSAWVLVCDNDSKEYGDTNIGAIHAACRQLGYGHSTHHYTIQ